MKMLSRTKDILIFEYVKRQLKLEKEQQQATKMAGEELQLSTSNSRNGFKRKNQGNWIGKNQSNEESEHDQQGKEKCARGKDLMQAQCLNCDQMGHNTHDCTEPMNVLSNIF